MKTQKLFFVLVIIFFNNLLLKSQDWKQDTIISSNNASMVLLKDSTVFTNEYGSNKIFIYEKEEDGLSNTAILTISDMANDELISTFTFAIYDSTLIIGEERHSISSSDSTFGSVYIFEKSINGWESTNTPSYVIKNYEFFLGFGAAIDIYKNEIVVSSPFENDFIGAVYVYKKVANQWNKIAKLTCTESDLMQDFGHDVAIDENYIYVGENTGDNPGIYIFEKPSNDWVDTTESYKITSEKNPEMLGWSMDASNSYIVAGSPWSTEQNIYIFYPNNILDWSSYSEIEVETTTIGNEKVGYNIKVWKNFFIYNSGGGKVILNEINKSDKTITEIFSFPSGIYDVDFNGKYIILGDGPNGTLIIYKNEGSILSNSDEGKLSVLDFSVFPNPVQNKLLINNLYNEEIVQVEIISYDGSLIQLQSIKGTNNLLEIDFEGIEQGLYILNIKSKKGLFSKKIIKI